MPDAASPAASSEHDATRPGDGTGGSGGAGVGHTSGMRSIGLRNHALTMALLAVVLCIIFFTARACRALPAAARACGPLPSSRPDAPIVALVCWRVKGIATSWRAHSTRWVLSDEARPAGTVIEVTPLISGTPRPLIRVHGPKTKPFHRMRLEADVTSPHTTSSYPAAHGERCVRLRLTSDPWVVRDEQHRLHPDGTPYHLRLVVEGP